MDTRKTERNLCRRIFIYLRAICSIIVLVAISTLVWMIGCEIVWYGTLWIEEIYKLKEQFYVYKIITLLFFLGLGILTVVLSVSFVLLGIPFMVVHLDYFCNRQQIEISNVPTATNEELPNPNSKQAFKWTISIVILIIVGLAMGGVGCEVMQWSGIKFRAVSKNINETNRIDFYLNQCLFLVVMFAGLLLSFLGLLLAPFTLAFAGVVSFDINRNSYRLRSRRRRESLHQATSEI